MKIIGKLALCAAVFVSSFHAPVASAQAQNKLTSQEKKDGWKLLFDGKTPDGWIAVNGTTFPVDKAWEVRDGMLTVKFSGGEQTKNASDIISTDEYGAFDLKFDFKMSTGANSGLKYFVNIDGQKGGGGLGLEYQVLDDLVHPDAKLGRNGDRTLASLYDIIPANKPANILHPIGQWNSGRIIVYPDNRVEHYLNGYKVLEYVRKSSAFQDSIKLSKFKNLKGFGMYDKGHILLQDHGFEVNYRNIKIKTL